MYVNHGSLILMLRTLPMNGIPWGPGSERDLCVIFRFLHALSATRAKEIVRAEKVAIFATSMWCKRNRWQEMRTDLLQGS